MPRMKSRVSTKNITSKHTTKVTSRKNAIVLKKNTGTTMIIAKQSTASKGQTKKTATPVSIVKTRPTTKELQLAAKKVMKQYSIAIKNLAKR